MKKIAIIQTILEELESQDIVLDCLNNKPILEWVVDFARSIPLIDDVIVLEACKPLSKNIRQWCFDHNLEVFSGEGDDLLSCFYDAAKAYNADTLLLIKGNCPFLDKNIAEQALYLVSSHKADYASNTEIPTWPQGLECEAFSWLALECTYKEATLRHDRMNVTSYIRSHQNRFVVRHISSPLPEICHYRLVVDTTTDIKFLQSLLDKTQGSLSTWKILDVLSSESTISTQHNEQKIQDHRGEDKKNLFRTNFKNSQEFLKRALNTIPFGSQTFSKSHIQYPQSASPLFLTHGVGSKVWDIDGNEYIDLINGLLPVVLGYNDVDVNQAIQNQLHKGISFSLATPLEAELSELICALIPSAELVRFGKNGSDVTSAAVRIARAYTGRDKVIVCGYHGWQDWYIGATTRNKGVPKAVAELTYSVPYNDLNKVEDLLKTEEFACMIMEPCNIAKPIPGYLQGVKNLCELYGSILVFDEIITGFRFSLGGAQDYFGVTPHVSCFGKAMGNGMPISAIVGQKHIMREMEDIFFSGTFGGETLSLAAAIATITKMKEKKVVPYLWKKGQALFDNLNAMIKEFDLSDVLSLEGFAPWSILCFKDCQERGITSHEFKTLFQHEMIKNGVLIIGSNNISFSHGDCELINIVNAYRSSFQTVKLLRTTHTFSSLVNCPVITPLFQVR